MQDRIFRATTLLTVGALACVAAVTGVTQAAPESVELDAAEVFIEWHATDDEYGLHLYWDSEGFTKMQVRNERRKPVFDVKAKKGMKTQGVAEAKVESVAYESGDLALAEFLERFPEGEYSFKGRGVERERLFGEADLTHVLPAPPTSLDPGQDDTVDHNGFTASFDPVTEDADGNAIDIAYYVVVFEKEDDEPILQTFEVILRPSVTSVFVPEEFLEPDTEYAFEVIAVEESGNRTVVEVDGITTDD